mgnify:CR=1 FL=1
MLKYLFLLVFCLTVHFDAIAQNKSLKEAYLEFKIYRTTDEDKPLQIEQTLALLKFGDELTAKQLTNIHYHLGKMYEEIEEFDSALVYYEKSLLGEPNYEVTHRALGFIYFAKSNRSLDQLHSVIATKDKVAYEKAFDAYKIVAKKAILHLEKYQACDPDEDTLKMITSLYHNIKDTQALATLPARLKELGKTCVTLLDED